MEFRRVLFRSNRLQRSRLALVTLGHFLNDSYGSFFTPILPLLIEKLSLSLTAASGLAAIPSITAAIFQPLYGMASDRIRGRLFILLGPLDRKSTRLNSSHSQISYAVFCLKKKKQTR